METFLTHVARAMAADLEKSDYQEGCPIATTALETSAQSEVLGDATANAFRKWETEISRGLERFGMGNDEADQLATMVLSQLEGALLLARTYRSLEPIERAEQALKLLARVSREDRSYFRLSSRVLRMNSAIVKTRSVFVFVEQSSVRSCERFGLETALGCNKFTNEPIVRSLRANESLPNHLAGITGFALMKAFRPRTSSWQNWTRLTSP